MVNITNMYWHLKGELNLFKKVSAPREERAKPQPPPPQFWHILMIQKVDIKLLQTITMNINHNYIHKNVKHTVTMATVIRTFKIYMFYGLSLPVI